MMFRPDDPFPLLPEGSFTYAESQRHSAEVDAWLGFRMDPIETELASRPIRGPVPDGQNLWIGLPVKSLLTPYAEIRSILEALRPPPGSSIVDLGAGYGRMGFVVGRHFPEARFIGYELVLERVEEGLRCLKPWSYPLVSLEAADLKAPEFAPVEADSYFIYDFGSRAAIEKTLQDLRRIARLRPITVVARGRGSRDAIERGHPWLSQVHEPVHRAHYSFFRS